MSAKNPLLQSKFLRHGGLRDEQSTPQLIGDEIINIQNTGEQGENDAKVFIEDSKASTINSNDRRNLKNVEMHGAQESEGYHLRNNK